MAPHQCLKEDQIKAMRGDIGKLFDRSFPTWTRGLLIAVLTTAFSLIGWIAYAYQPKADALREMGRLEVEIRAMCAAQRASDKEQRDLLMRLIRKP